MRSLRKLGVLAILALALSAFGAANASADSEFTFSATGSLEGKALTAQVFHTAGGTVECTSAKTTGTIEKVTFTEQKMAVQYSGCTAFGFTNVKINPAEYLFTTHTVEAQLINSVHVLNTITIDVPAAVCRVTVQPQTVGTVSFETIKATGTTTNIKQKSNVTGIKYTSSGGFCGASGENGAYTGENEVFRVGGGSVAFDP